MNDLQLEYLPPTELHPVPGNARTHSAAQVRQITRSMKEFGFMSPVLIDAENRLIAGHGRLLSAKQLGLTRIPCVRVEHLTPDQQRAYMLADNKIAENAGWDKDLLRIELTYLMSAEVNFDVELTGFSTPEIDLAIAPMGTDEPPIPALSDTAVSAVGDIWELGRHRLACGDARDSDLMAALFGKEQARMLITDPPFNVKVDGHVGGLGKTKHAEFAMASGEMSQAEFTTFLEQALAAAKAVCMDGALLYLFMDWRHLQELQSALDALHLPTINLCVWVKTNGGMGSLYRSRHELILVAKNGKASHINNVELGKHGRYRTNVWNYAGMNTFGAERTEALALHPTVKPVAMVADAIKDVSKVGDIVLDAFLGSGTTLLAAERTRRRCFGVELDPRYVDVALRRWMALTGEEPVLRETGQTYAEVEEQRLAQKPLTDPDSESQNPEGDEVAHG